MYSGEGQPQARSTRDNHARDDKLLKLQEDPMLMPTSRASRFLPGASTPSVGANLQFNPVKLMEKEVAWYSGLPLTSPGGSLIFVNDPKSNGDYHWPSITDIVLPNSGPHALRTELRVNAAFLATESRYCELIRTLEGVKEQSDSRDTLLDQLHDELGRLHREKEIQWVQQRGRLSSAGVTFNTGELLPDCEEH